MGVFENSFGSDMVRRSVLGKVFESAGESAVWRIRRFASEWDWRADRPYSISCFAGNSLLNEGINELWTLVCSAGGTAFDNSNAYLGVGDGTTAVDPSQTGLQGSNKFYKAVDAGYPSYGTDQKATWKATFGSAEANFDWREFTVANGNGDAYKNLNRKTSNQGTKVAGQIWELTLEIALS